MARKRGRSVGDVARYTGTGTRTAPSPFGPDQDDEPVTSGVTFALVSIVVFIAICFFAVRFGTQAIEGDVQAQAQRALTAAGFTEVEVEAQGTDVTLSGTFTSEQNEDDAYAAVEAVSAVGTIDGRIWLISTEELGEATVRGAPLEATWTNGTVVIEGSLSTPEKAELVNAALEGAFATVDTSGLSVLEGLADESAWLGSILGLLQSVSADLPEGLLRADGTNGYVIVSGEIVDNRDLKDELNAKVKEIADTLGFDATPGVRLLETGPTKEEVEELQENLNEVVLDQVVEFEVQSFQLTAKGRTVLDGVVLALERAPEVRVLITGHTDDRGSTEANQELSELRATAVLDYLVAAGLEKDRFDTIGYGETRPVKPNSTSAGRAANRRIEFTALLDDVITEEDS